MNRFACCMALAAVFLAGGAVAETSVSDPKVYLTPENVAKLEAGEIILMDLSAEPGAPKGKGLAIILINKPRKEIWKHLADGLAQPEYMPSLLRNEYYETGTKEKGLKQTIQVLWNEVTYHVLQTLDEENCVLSWRIDESKENSIVATDGMWVLVPHGEDKTLAIYSLAVDTGIALPATIDNFLRNRNLPEVMKALKQRSESDGQYKKKS